MNSFRNGLIGASLLALRSDKFFRRLCGERLFVFMFHDVSSNPSDFSKKFNLNVSPSLFKRQIGLIKKYFKIIAPDQLQSQLVLDCPTALITFDDGLPGYFTDALPILESFDAPSIIFLNMEPVDGGYFWSALAHFICENDTDFAPWLKNNSIGNNAFYFLSLPESVVRRYLDSRVDREQYLKRVSEFHGGFASHQMLADAAARRGVFFGSHLYNHFNAVNISRHELEESYVRNEQSLRHFPNSLPFFAYPYGQPKSCFNGETHKHILNLGAKRLFESVQLFNESPNEILLHRINMTEDVNSEETFKRRVLFPTWRNMLRKKRFEPYLKIPLLEDTQ